jgi:2'-5' RNA ligase
MSILDNFPLKSAFLALPLENEAKLHFQMLQEQLRTYDDALRFQNPDSPHLTLYFWKELLKIEYDDVIPKIENIANKTSPFTLQINGADTFGKMGNERVLFLTVAFSPELATLKKLCPWPNPPDQPFSPHITITRIKHPEKFTVHRKKIMKIFNNVDLAMNVSLLRLYAEIDGHKQTPLKDFPFKLSP